MGVRRTSCTCYKGRARQGGQRVGEMEVLALRELSVRILRQMLTYKYDHIKAHQELLGATITGGIVPISEYAPKSYRFHV